MRTSVNVVTRSFRRWLHLALKNPRTTAAGLMAVATGVRLLWSGQLLEGVTAFLTGLGLVLGADAVTVSRNSDEIAQKQDQDASS